MKVLRFLAICLILSLSLLFMACEKEGPAERAGEQVDQAYEDTMENLEETKETLEDKLNPEGPAEKAGKEIDDAVEDLEE